MPHIDAPSRWHRIWSHEYFEARLAEECARARHQRSEFSVMRIAGVGDDDEVRSVFQQVLRVYDVVAKYGPNEWEVLLRDVSDDDARALARQIGGRLRGPDDEPELGMAEFPGDGVDPYSLVVAAAPRPLAADQVVPKPGPTLPDDIVTRVAQTDITVLIIGETGVGKEVMAEQIQRSSGRDAGPFVRLNCAALPETLIESELFGHEKGAFTGALSTKIGLLESAAGGTVFLDEIGELPMQLQAKLLRVLEDKTVLRVGALSPRHIDVRFIAATNSDLEAEVAGGRFRADLYFRINGFTLAIPPLRKRLPELEQLAALFVERANRAWTNRATQAVTPAAMTALRTYPWPGNIRELRNVMERAVILSDGAAIAPQHLALGTNMFVWQRGSMPSATSVESPTAPAPLERSADERTHASADEPDALPAETPADTSAEKPTDTSADESLRDRMHRQLEQVERQAIVDALAQEQGNQTAAAKLLGLSRRTLVSRLTRYQLRSEDSPAD